MIYYWSLPHYTKPKIGILKIENIFSNGNIIMNLKYRGNECYTLFFNSNENYISSKLKCNKCVSINKYGIVDTNGSGWYIIRKFNNRCSMKDCVNGWYVQKNEPCLRCKNVRPCRACYNISDRVFYRDY